MITTPTVLVLGAGTSTEYGFPTARDLKADVSELFGREKAEGIQALCEPGAEVSENRFMEFCEALRLSGQPSVDAYLERNPDYERVGKLALAYCLIRYEREEALFPARSEQHLYEYIFERLGADISSFGKNKLSVLTFNYDRSLEHYLATALYNSNRTTAVGKQVYDAVEKIEIIHLYGQLAPLPWQTAFPTSELPRKYRPDLSPASVHAAAESIKTIHGRSDHQLVEDRDFNRAWELIEGARKICFLGFDYYPRNLSRLKIDNSKGRWQIYGTSKGLAKSELDEVKRKLNDPILEEVTSLAFLRHHGILD